jgi:hypothetical protein
MTNSRISQPITTTINVNVPNKSPIFIVGCDRSGTTLLRLMLNQSPVLYITPETKFLTSLKQNQAIYGDFTQSYQRYFLIRDLQTNQATSKTFTFPIFGLTIVETEQAIATVAPTNFAIAAQAIFQASVIKKNKQRWGDKTPHQVKHINSLAKSFPNAQFIHVIRDGRDVAISMRKAGWLKGNMLAIAQYWQQQVQAGISAGRSLDNNKNRYYEMYYEQLVQQPEATLKDLCAWLHLEYTPQMLEYYRDADTHIQPEHSNLFELNRKPIDASRAYAWKSQLSHQDIADFESIAGNLLSALGYELNGAKISLTTKLIRIFKSLFTPFLYQLKKKLEI